MTLKKGVFQIPLILLLLSIIVASVAIYIKFGKSLGSKTSQQSTSQQSSTNQTKLVVPQTIYANPFDTNTQYQNPFEISSNPFDNL